MELIIARRAVYRIIIMHTLLLVATFTKSYSKTWCVPNGVVTIKMAIEDSSTYGDTVLVAPGTYDTTSGEYFPINMRNGVVLMSEYGSNVTIIDANRTARVIKCDNLDSITVISGFTISGGLTSRGGGIYCNNSYVQIRNNNIKDNVASGSNGLGGGIHVNGGSPIIASNTISDNSSSNRFAGGIYCVNTSATIIDNIVSRNVARWGGGIFSDGCSPTIKDNIVEGNHSVESGGGIDCYQGASPLITGNVVVRNSAGTNGAGIACCYNSSPTIMNNTVVANIADFGGGVRTLGNSKPIVTANAIVDNVDAIYLIIDSGKLTATDNNIYANTYQEGDREVINNTSITLNLTNNFWWKTDSTTIDSLISGSCNFAPFRNSPNDSAPGEPLSVISVTVMSDSTYSKPLTGSSYSGDTIYIELVGTDWNPAFIEPAMVVITSASDSHGIVVALIETESSSGIYQGRAHIRTTSSDKDDQIGADPGDMIIIKANIDFTKCDTVMVGQVGLREFTTTVSRGSTYGVKSYPNPFTGKTSIKYVVAGSPRKNIYATTDHYPLTTLRIYDLVGRLIRTLMDEPKQPGHYQLIWNCTDDSGNTVVGGIYFCYLSFGFHTSTHKLIVLE